MEWLRVRKRSSHNTDNASELSDVDELDSHPFSKDPSSMVKVKILPGMSHGFFQMCNFLAEANQAVSLTTEWIHDMFMQDVKPDSSDLTSMMVSEIQEVSETTVLLRRRHSMANKMNL